MWPRRCTSSCVPRLVAPCSQATQRLWCWCSQGRRSMQRQAWTLDAENKWVNLLGPTGLDIKHLVYVPVGQVVLKSYMPCKIFMCPANICTSPLKLMSCMYTAGEISACPDWKNTCPVGHITTKIYVPWDKIYMPWACGHALMSSPGLVTSYGDRDLGHHWLR